MEGWDGKQDGRKVQEGEVYLWLIHVDIWQKTTKFCKAIILKSEKKIVESDPLTDICILPSSIQKLLFRPLWCGRSGLNSLAQWFSNLVDIRINPHPEFVTQWIWGGAPGFAFPKNAQILLLLTWSPAFWVSPVWYMFSTLFCKAVKTFLRWNIIVIKKSNKTQCWGQALGVLSCPLYLLSSNPQQT